MKGKESHCILSFSTGSVSCGVCMEGLEESL